MKEPSIYKILLSVFVLFTAACGGGYSGLESDPEVVKSTTSEFLVPGQSPIPSSIKGVQFYRKNYPGSPPIIRLGTSDKLELKFDELSSLSGRYRINITHHNKDWSRSSLADVWVFDNSSETDFGGGTLNSSERPNFYSYSFSFPNRELQFLVSGNYLLHIYDYQSGIELFSLPFFVTENKGDLQPDVETIFNAGPYGAAMHELSGKFLYPEFVEFPQFDLSYTLVQNRYWGSNVFPNETSFTGGDFTTFRTTRNQLFAGYKEFYNLDLRSLSTQNAQIYGIDRAEIPQKVILRTDYFNFSSDLRTITETGFGRPLQSQDAAYVEVIFRYETQGAISRNSEIFLLGDFNQWKVSEDFKLDYNSESGFLETSALIKQGIYNYRYVVFEDGQIKPLRNLETLNQKPQEYAAFVYYQDPQQQYHRLLSTRIFYSE
ncbi:MAG: DUF5103 domain-containing protein [Balneolaceae bacterium]|nr:DUF5103 domain-containing protein [Balneolaceae bacterium]